MKLLDKKKPFCPPPPLRVLTISLHHVSIPEPIFTSTCYPSANQGLSLELLMGNPLQTHSCQGPVLMLGTPLTNVHYSVTCKDQINSTNPLSSVSI